MFSLGSIGGCPSAGDVIEFAVSGAVVVAVLVDRTWLVGEEEDARALSLFKR
jgi:hypothetical protein